MTEIAPTPPAPLLANQLATAPPLPLSGHGLPPVLPVQITALPSALALPEQQALNMQGALQLQMNGNAMLQAAEGAVLLNLPQLRGNAALFQAINQYSAENGAVTLRIMPGQQGAWTAQLLFPQSATPRAATANAAASGLAGQVVQAIILPAGQSRAAPTASLKTELENPAAPMGEQALMAVSKTGGAPVLKPEQKIEQKIEQWLRQWLPSPATPQAMPKSGAAASPAAQLLATASTSQTLLSVKVQQVLASGQAVPPLQADEILAHAANPAATAESLVVTAGQTGLLLKTGQTVQPGSALILKLLPLQEQAESFTPIMDADGGWPLLRQLAGALQTASANPAWQHFVQTRLPRPDASLGGVFLVLLAALRQQDPKPWMGRDGIAALEQAGKKSMLDSFQDELRRNSGTTADAVVGEWRFYHLPLLDQQQVLPVHVYVHHSQPRQRGEGHDREEAESAAKAKQTRFVIDVTFTRLGAMQLDGFVQARQFDLMLRSRLPLTDALQQELRTAFHQALEAVGYGGQIIFQPGGQHWLFLTPTAAHDSRQI